jgi:nicotinamide mononucleotide (NMN) deamidase PncC
MKTGVVCYSKDNKQHVINLKQVEYYSVEAIQMSEPEEKAV